MAEETEAPKFGAALDELEAIVRAIESDEIDLDDLADQVDRAAELVQLCRERITHTEARVRNIIEGLEEPEPQ